MNIECVCVTIASYTKVYRSPLMVIVNCQLGNRRRERDMYYLFIPIKRRTKFSVYPLHPIFKCNDLIMKKKKTCDDIVTPNF